MARKRHARRQSRGLSAIVLQSVLSWPTEDTGASCKARAKLSLKALHELSNEVAADLEEEAIETWSWKNRSTKLVDGFTFTMPAELKNEAEFPHPKTQKKGRWSADCSGGGHSVTGNSRRDGRCDWSVSG